jgi:hypothetical protein
MNALRFKIQHSEKKNSTLKTFQQKFNSTLLWFKASQVAEG